jgi:hypothetical protein
MHDISLLVSLSVLCTLMSPILQTMMLRAEGSRSLEQMKEKRQVPVVLAGSEQFHLIGVGVHNDADHAFNVATVSALQRTAVYLEQMHGVGADGQDIIG